jgi:hypothetical protein
VLQQNAWKNPYKAVRNKVKQTTKEALTTKGSWGRQTYNILRARCAIPSPCMQQRRKEKPAEGVDSRA